MTLHRFEMPWPSHRLSPNSRLHWTEIHRAKRKARGDAYQLAHAQIRSRPIKGPVKARITFTPPDKRRYDTDNLIARVKAQIDGIADAIDVDDSQWEMTFAPQSKPQKPGWVTYEIEEQS